MVRMQGRGKLRDMSKQEIDDCGIVYEVQEKSMEFNASNPKYILAVKRLHFWQYGNNPNNFTSILYTLISKADSGNKRRLKLAFPEEFAAWMEWYQSEGEDAFFEKYNLKPFSFMYDQEPPK